MKQTASSRWGTSGDHFDMLESSSAGCSYQGDINPRNWLLDSRYKTPPKIGLDWLNKNANDGLAKNKQTNIKTYFQKRLLLWFIQRRNQKGEHLEA